VVAESLPGCEVTGVAAGLQCLLRLPPGTDEARIVREAGDRGLRLAGLGSFRAPGSGNQAALVIGYGGATPGQYETALAVLVESIMASAARRQRSGEPARAGGRGVRAAR
jgi:GntR family transcriptional regulator / MocR family aminotransferase